MQNTMCSSRKYPYPPHGRDFSYDPPSPLDFPKIDSQNGPPLPSGNSVFVAHPLEILSSLWKPKIRHFFKYKIPNFDPYRFFFPKNLVDTVTDTSLKGNVAYIKDAYRGICDMQITDLIP